MLVPFVQDDFTRAFAITCDLTRPSTRAIHAHFTIAGPIQQLAVPLPGSPERTDGLWQYLCFELFLRTADQAPYVEVNFSPSSAWAYYRFTDARTGQSSPHAPVIHSHLVTTATMLMLDLHLLMADEPALDPDGTWMANATVVTESVDGRRDYWSWHHPTDRPDFHHPDGFIRSLPAPSQDKADFR